MPVYQEDAQFIETEQAIKLTVKDLNSNAKFSEIHNKIKEEHSELKDAQLIVGVVKTTLSEIIYDICYSLNNEYYSVHAIYNVENHKKLIGKYEKLSLITGYTEVQNGHNSQSILDWLLKEQSDLKAGVISSMGRKQSILGTLWNFYFKLPTKNVRVVVQEEGNNRQIIY